MQGEISSARGDDGKSDIPKDGRQTMIPAELPQTARSSKALAPEDLMDEANQIQDEANGRTSYEDISAVADSKIAVSGMLRH